MSAPCKFAPAADATNHATTTDEQTASASPIMDMNIARTAQRFLLFPLAKGRANDSGASNRSRSVFNKLTVPCFHAAILDQVDFQQPSNNNTQQTAGFCPTPWDD
ncbi:hypothetical protein PCANC_10113 [Puccinia coronata f. sp. avenae]|uniref:Uncharacterized protein n=1 Tax=Puccinia coronata f. sp. avenae TaxID=200324 RepID=A0A2N5V765_9BASI|nr:hypothetical protein PCANC_10113 [Puccinia coronata f. sp. avenae]